MIINTRTCSALVFITLAACGDDDSAGVTDAVASDTSAETAVAPDSNGETTDGEDLDLATEEVSEALGPGSFRWDPAAVTPGDFYAYPWPSDLRVSASGAPDLQAFSTERARTTILEDAIASVEAGAPGFSPLASAYFGLAVDLDEATLADNVLLIDVGRAEILASSVEWNGPGGGYWPPRTLAVHADYQIPPPSGARLAAVLLSGIRTRAGDALEAPAAVSRLDALEGPEADSLRTVLPALDALGIPRTDVIAWTTWESADPMAELRGLASWVEGQDPAPVGALELVRRRPNYDQYRGEITIVEAFSGDPPYSTPFGAGLITLTPDGAPATPTSVTIPFTLSVPRGAMPAEGFPLITYGHGLGETHEGFLRTAAGPLGSRGVAVIGLDPPLQGTRNITGIDDRTLIVQLSVGNIVGGREVLRQGVFDYLQLVHAVASPGFVVPAEVAADGVELSFDASRLGFFGHSEGAQIGALLLPLTPRLGPAAFSEGGGGAAITMLALKLAEIDVSATVAEFLGVDHEIERWSLGHPLVTAVIQPLLDSADPLHLGRRMIREPLEGGRAHDLVMLEGFLDDLTPPASMEALASSIGLPIAEPVARAIPGLDAQGIGPVPLPASANLPEVGGYTPTGALLQLPEHDHYIIYFDVAVRDQLMEFLTSALAGDARLEPVRP